MSLNRLKKNITICSVYLHYRPEYSACVKRYADLRDFVNTKVNV